MISIYAKQYFPFYISTMIITAKKVKYGVFTCNFKLNLLASTSGGGHP